MNRIASSGPSPFTSASYHSFCIRAIVLVSFVVHLHGPMQRIIHTDRCTQEILFHNSYLFIISCKKERSAFFYAHAICTASIPLIPDAFCSSARARRAASIRITSDARSVNRYFPCRDKMITDTRLLILLAPASQSRYGKTGSSCAYPIRWPAERCCD
jgi:hypothetical protein